jgi:hypothetical protein
MDNATHQDKVPYHTSDVAGYLALSRISDRPYTASLKRIGDKGSPCLTPHASLKWGPTSILKLMPVLPLITIYTI